MVSFNFIAPDYKLPGTSIEVDPSQAGTPVNPKYALLMGYKTAAGTAPANATISVGTVEDAKALFGAGSQLARMYERFFGINRSQLVYCLPVAEPGAGTAAAANIVVTAAPTTSGPLYLYIAGQRVAVATLSTDTAAQTATKIRSAVNAATDLPVAATGATDTVILTAKWKGADGNDIRVEHSLLGFAGGEVLPGGIGLTFPASNVLAGGAGVPDLTTTLTVIGDSPYKFVAFPWTDTAALAGIALEYGFSDAGRWGWLRQSYGQAFTAKRDSYSNLAAWGPTYNHPVVHAWAVELKSPSPVWEWTAAITAQAARGFTNDPARPLQTLEITGVMPAPKDSRFSKTELNGLAKLGLAIQGTDIDGANTGVPIILREQSMYQKNTAGQADNAFELATTLATLDEVFTRLRAIQSNRFPRHKLANNDTRIGPGQAVVTPNIMKGELLSEYRRMEFIGLVENFRAFKDNLIVVRSAVDPNTLECLYPPDLINQLRRFNVRAAFRLQFPEAL